MPSALKIEIAAPVGGQIGALLETGQAGLIGEMRRGVGTAIADELRAHFEQLDHERAGKVDGVSVGTGTHFWQQVAEGVQQPRVAGDDVVIGINHVGLRQRLEGGTIHAVDTHFLAIPVDQQAYGKRPGDFPAGALVYVVLPHGGPALLLAEHTDRIATKGKNAGQSVAARAGQEATHGAGSVMFLLRESVDQPADPSVLPPEADIIRTALTAGDAAAALFLGRLADGAPPGNR